MTFREFNVLVLSKSSQRKTLVLDDVYIEKVYAAMKRVARDTVSLELLVNSPKGQKILRKVDNDAYIRYPIKAIAEDDTIDMEEALLDAVAYMIMAGMETQRAKVYMGLYYTEIENNDAVQIEATFSTASANPSNRDPDEVFA